MPDQSKQKYTTEAYTAYMDERKTLIEAARESARSFDQAVLAFGAAIFGASVAFLKDVAPHPAPYTLKWLLAAWLMFSVGLLGVLFSFLYSHKACMFEIDAGSETLGNPNAQRQKNKWSLYVDICNYACVALLFAGLCCWSVFAFENLNRGDSDLPKPKCSSDQVERGYAPSKAPPPPPAKPNPSSAPVKK